MSYDVFEASFYITILYIMEHKKLSQQELDKLSEQLGEAIGKMVESWKYNEINLNDALETPNSGKLAQIFQWLTQAFTIVTQAQKRLLNKTRKEKIKAWIDTWKISNIYWIFQNSAQKITIIEEDPDHEIEPIVIYNKI